jgi:hypothetical protein
VEIEHFKDTICMGVCTICGKTLAGKDEVLVVRSDLFPEAAVHRKCCHARLQEHIDDAGLNVLALHLESEWNQARRFAVWFKK